MKLVLALLATLMCVNVYLTSAQTLRCSCTVSGDPHIMMLDGVGVHFQGLGTFSVVKTDRIEVQTTTRRWGLSVTAMRASTTRLRSVATRNIFYNTMVGWGSWGGTGVISAWGPYPRQNAIVRIIDPVVISTPASIGITTNVDVPSRTFNISACALQQLDGINTYTCPYNSLINKDVFINRGEFKITVGPNAAAPSVLITQQNVKFPIEVRIVWWTFLSVTLPNAPDIISKTNGLCGFWDGSPATEFIDANNTNLVTATPIFGGRWYATPTTEKWGNSFGVGSDSLLLPGYVKNVAGVAEDEELPKAIVADEASLDMLDKISFNSLADLNAAQNVCEQQVPPDQQGFVTPCVFDLAVASGEKTNGAVDANGFASMGHLSATAYEMAMANVLAAQIISETQNEDKSVNALYIGVGIAGAVAAVAIVAVAVIAVKLRRTRALMQLTAGTSSTSVSISM